MTPRVRWVRTLVSEKALFSASYAAKTLATYALAPGVARFLDGESGGRFFLYLTVINLGGLAVTLGLPTYLQRARGRLITAAQWRAVAVMSVLPSALVVWVLFGLLGKDWAPIVLLAVVFRGMSLFGEARLLGNGRTALMAVFALGQAALVVASTLFLSSWPSAAVAVCGLIAADALCAQALFGGHRGERSEGGTFTWKSRDAFAYSLPLLATNLLNYGMNSLDRFALVSFMGATSLVDYSVSYTVSFAGHRLLGSPANVRLTADYLRGVDDEVGASAKRDAATGVILVALWGLTVVVVGQMLLRALVGREVEGGPLINGLIASAAILFSAFSLDTMTVKRAGNTVFLTVALATAVLVNGVLNVALIPRVGVVGAAWASFGAYGVLYLVYGRARRSRVVSGKLVALAVALVLACATYLERL